MIDRPIPGRDETADPDRLFEYDLSVVEALLLFQLFQRVDESIEVADRRICLRLPGHRNGRAHLKTHGLRKLFKAALADKPNAPQQCQSLRFTGLTKVLKRRLCCRDRHINIRLITQSNLRHLVSRSRVENGHRLSGLGHDPLAIDIKLQ